MKRDERVQGARKCTGEEGGLSLSFHFNAHSLSFILPPVPCPLLPFHFTAIAMVFPSVRLPLCYM